MARPAASLIAINTVAAATETSAMRRWGVTAGTVVEAALVILAWMPERAPTEVVYDVVCPHCGKTFEGELLSGGAPRYQGFKCPHCRLFVAYERVEELEREEPGA